MIFVAFQGEASTTVSCNSCSAYTSYFTQAYNKAEALSENSYQGFSGPVYVINPVKNASYGWNFSTNWVMSGGDEPELVVNVNSISVPSNIVATVDQLYKSELYTHMREAQWGIEVPVDSGFDSAWDIARNSSTHGRLDDWYHDAYPFTYWTRTALDIAAQIAAVDILVGFEAKFIFSDKSTARFKVNTVQSGELEFTYIAGSATDKDNNKIADQGLSLEGTYTFSSQESLQEFVDRALMHGIELQIIHTNGTGGNGGTVTFRAIPKR